MKNIYTVITKYTTWHIIAAVALGITVGLVPELTMAQFYNGPGIVGGINQAEAVGGVTGRGLRQVILDLLFAVLVFMGLAAVVVIVIAGIWLVVSVGDESAKEKAKKIILYAVVGLIIISLAAAIVLFIINATGGGGIFGPVPDIGTGTDIRTTVLGIIKGILNFMALVAVVVIVIAGIYMVVSLGDEQAKDRAKRIILYTVVGLLIILFASAIVGFVSSITDNV